MAHRDHRNGQRSPHAALLHLPGVFPLIRDQVPSGAQLRSVRGEAEVQLEQLEASCFPAAPAGAR